MQADQVYRGKSDQNYQYSSTTTNQYGHYDPSSGYYSSTSTTSPNTHYLTPVIQAVASGVSSSNTFNLCMKSKGYYKVQATTSENRPNSESLYRGGSGTACVNSYDCEVGFFCDDDIWQDRAEVERKKEKIVQKRNVLAKIGTNLCSILPSCAFSCR